jgi:hypothetical protein
MYVGNVFVNKLWKDKILVKFTIKFFKILTYFYRTAVPVERSYCLTALWVSSSLTVRFLQSRWGAAQLKTTFRDSGTPPQGRSTSQAGPWWSLSRIIHVTTCLALLPACPIAAAARPNTWCPDYFGTYFPIELTMLTWEEVRERGKTLAVLKRP